jgi:hypothetical protein
MRSSASTTPPVREADEAFLERLRLLGENWRYSDEFIGIVVRARFPERYEQHAGRSDASTAFGEVS